MAVWSNTDGRALAAGEALKREIKEKLVIDGSYRPSTYIAKSTTARALKEEISQSVAISNNVGAAVKAIDSALPGKRTKALYQGNFRISSPRFRCLTASPAVSTLLCVYSELAVRWQCVQLHCSTNSGYLALNWPQQAHSVQASFRRIFE